MKSVLLTITFLVASPVFAFSGKLPPANDHSGNEQCRFYDAGSTEEHAPHISALECESKHNGKCDMRCYVYESRCEVKGTNIRIEKQSDGSERRIEETKNYSATERDENEAREVARYNCEHDFPRNESCLIQSCSDIANRTK
jgi:hypothetical protein